MDESVEDPDKAEIEKIEENVLKIEEVQRQRMTRRNRQTSSYCLSHHALVFFWKSNLLYCIYFTLLYFTLLYFTLLYFTLLYFTLLYFTLLYFTLLHFTFLTIPYLTVPYCTSKSV